LYALSSAASWAVDTGGFFLLSLLFMADLGDFTEPLCNVAARVISSFFNFNLNNRLVFRNTGSYGKACLRYYCLAVPQLAASTLLLTLLVYVLKIETTHGSTVVKIIVDGGLFVASYFIQKFWVFGQKKNETDKPAELETAEK
jgi:putative flippase GtrA